MDNTSRKSERRSLLPQKSGSSGPLAASKISSHGSRSRVAYSNENVDEKIASTHAVNDGAVSNVSTESRRIDVIKEDEERKAPPKQATKLQPPASIGRSLSLRSQNEHSSGQCSIQRSRSIKRLEQSARVSRIGAPQTIKEDTRSSEADKEEPSTMSKSPPLSKILDIEPPDRPNTRIKNPENNRKASTTHSNTSVSRHTRASSQQIPAKPSSEAKRPPSTDSTAPKPATSKTQRPAFSTLQQHFTPRKAPKATTASITAPSNKHVDETSSPETTRLQMELLQLHLLHRDSAAVHTRWGKSARRHFKRQHESLSKQQLELDDQERSAHTAVNYPALVAWSQSSSSAEFAERIQILSRNLQEISSFLQPGSKYSRVTSLFEAWSTTASRIRISRQSPSRNDQLAAMEFIEDIGDSWKSEITYLERKLVIAEEELKELGEPREEGSSIKRVVELLKGAVAGLLGELAAMKDVEGDLMRLEAKWVEGEVQRLVGEDGDGRGEVVGRGIWHERKWGCL